MTLFQVLCIHLKRFKHDTLFGTKISDTVAFPLDNLDISPFCVQIDGEDEQKKKDFASKLPFTTNYELVSIVNHRGGYSGGHYVSYCYNRAANKWQEFDDKYVSSVSADDVAGREAYLLFYVKKPTAKQTAQHRLIDQSLREKVRLAHESINRLILTRVISRAPIIWRGYRACGSSDGNV